MFHVEQFTFVKFNFTFVKFHFTFVECCVLLPFPRLSNAVVILPNPP